jgi:hypothetical protein
MSQGSDPGDTFLLRLCILPIMMSIEAIVSSEVAVPSWAFLDASLRLAVIALVSLSMFRCADLKLRRMSSRGTLRSGASRISWLSAISFVGFPIIVLIVSRDSTAQAGDQTG